ncbi:MAG TPA: lipopolysaccharide biosynthesis protein, partial [Aquabacterium sp.]|nr:lipopolysaccharide biosynthesis protein [Aquabacterium sp.]
FIDRTASLVIAIASSMVIARLLSPADIGVFSVVMVLMSFLSSWRDFGAGQYLVQEPDLTDDRIRAVWTLQLCIGAGLALIALATSGLVARFYNEPRMAPIMWLLALSYLINPFGSLTYAWLMRTMRFEALTLMRASAALSGAAVSIGCAWTGLGAISLAWGSLASIVGNALVSLFFRPRGFPLLPGLREVRRVLQFGTRLTSSSLIETAAKGAPELILGKLQGMSAVGQFSRANGLLSMLTTLVTDAVGSVALPMFARQRREGGDMGHAFVRGNGYMTVVCWCFAAYLGVMAGPMILLLYGPQWTEAVDVARWLAVSMLLAGPATLSFQVLVGAGAADRLPRTMLIVATCTVMSATWGARHGAVSMAIGLCAGTSAATLVWLREVHQAVGFDLRLWSGTLVRSAVVAAGTATPAMAGMLWVGWMPEQPVLMVALTAVGGALAFVATVLAIGHPIADEIRPVLSRLRQRQG